MIITFPIRNPGFKGNAKDFLMKGKRNGADWLPFQKDRKHWGEKKV